MTKAEENRVGWVDVFKFLGIWAIYVGHLGAAAGKAYLFVYTYHVPMFFFAAGFFSLKALQEPLLKFIKKKTFQLMVPYAVFGIIALVVFTLQNNWEVPQVKNAFISLIYGIRNQVFAGSLWFLPCLYLIIIINYFVAKLFRSRFSSVLVAVGTLIVTQTLLANNPWKTPSWFMNLDSALFYYIYYSLGALFFPLLNQEVTSFKGRIIEGILMAGALLIAAMVFFKGFDSLLGRMVAPFADPFMLKIFSALIGVFIAITIIYLNVVIAKLFSQVIFLRELGRETLIFCGTENVLKSVLIQLLMMLGLQVNLLNPFVAVVFALLCLVVSKYTCVAFLNGHFPEYVGKKKLPN